MKIKFAIILAALMLAATGCAQDAVIEPESETTPITVETDSEKEIVSEPEIINEASEYAPSPEYKPHVTQTIKPMPGPEPEPESEPTAQVAMFEDNNQVVVEVVYKGNCYIGDVHEQLFQKNIGLSTEIPVYTIKGTFIPIEGYEGKTWYEFQGDTVWTLDESYLGFIPNANEEYTLFVSDNWTSECPDKVNHGDDCECAIYDDFFICVQDY